MSFAGRRSQKCVKERTQFMTAQTFSTSFEAQAAQPANWRLWTGRLLSGLASIFFLVDGGMKLFKPPFVVEATLRLGYPESSIIGIGIALVLSTVLYLVPRTSILGAVLLTGYLGGAVATHVRVSDPIFSILFPVVFGAISWAGLWLRSPHLRRLLPVISSER